MKILLAGPPACGKGTVGQELEEMFGIPLISTGQVLRDLPKDHPRYAENKKLMDAGDLAPNDLAADVIKERLSRDDCKNGYILDGYGRIMEQVELFEPELDKVVLINISEEETLRRITGRRTCESDGKVYNIYTLPREELVKCPGPLIQRDDDKKEVVLRRLELYRKETLPVIEYFRKKGLVVEVSGMGTVQEELNNVLEVLRPLLV